MNNKNQTRNAYDDGNIPEIDLPHNTQEFRQPGKSWATQEDWITEPLPESTRPRKDGPGGSGQ